MSFMLVSFPAAIAHVQPPAPTPVAATARLIGRRAARTAGDPATERGCGLHGYTFERF